MLHIVAMRQWLSRPFFATFFLSFSVCFSFRNSAARTNSSAFFTRFLLENIVTPRMVQRHSSPHSHALERHYVERIEGNRSTG